MATPKVDAYRRQLHEMTSEAREGYLAANSHLPGPRGNLELLFAAAEELTGPEIRRCAGKEDEFLAACGAVGLGRLAAEGDRAARRELHDLANDARWRVREGVAMALQRIGDSDRSAMLDLAEEWARDPSLFVGRAAAAGICEPRLLDSAVIVERTLTVLDRLTESMAAVDGPRDDGFRALRKALGYCWSVAVAAAPEKGSPLFTKWSGVDHPDVRWVVKQNVGKARLRRAAPELTATIEMQLRGD